MVESTPLSSRKELIMGNNLLGEFEENRPYEWCGRYEMERYCITYVWDDGEMIGVKTITNLTLKQAKHKMMSLEKEYPSFVKHAIMAKMVEEIR